MNGSIFSNQSSSGTRDEANDKGNASDSERIDTLESITKDLKRIQTRLTEEQAWQRNFLYLGWIVIVVTLVATVIALFNLIIDFYSYKNYIDDSDKLNETVVNNNFYISTTTSEFSN